MFDIWEYRGLICKIAVTDLKLRYKNSVFGLFWSLLQPLLMFLILFFVFSTIFKDNQIQYYPLYLLLGIVSWGFLDKGTGFSLNSIVSKGNLIKKIYFPREVLVISACLTALMMSAIEFVVFGGFMVAYMCIRQTIISPGISILLFPVLLLIEFFIVLGISLGIASLNVKYRDVQWIWGVIMQAGFFATPIMYSIDIFKDSQYAWILASNPIGVLMELMRDSLIYGINNTVSLNLIWFVVLVCLIVLGAGWLIFNKIEPEFAEEV
ncbi:ABC transporter permease [Methanocella arvoryzae]|uniref:ABC-type transport system, permease component (ABC-2 family) n=1 Tax=Methanocella arvoryzae (strain DSM 22066 / NBRC 105507 / MRE50) TaxID=351160 RepID=Q0W7E7_METAR|nr:ABC transporter permease [Methanocella arvoryzae]CAJ35696.1 putative ABC-type transport system, permease component (ABC-2 family) [Methanocella arvoryzae MRE50]